MNCVCGIYNPGKISGMENAGVFTESFPEGAIVAVTGINDDYRRGIE